MPGRLSIIVSENKCLGSPVAVCVMSVAVAFDAFERERESRRRVRQHGNQRVFEDACLT